MPYQYSKCRAGESRVRAAICAISSNIKVERSPERRRAHQEESLIFQGTTWCFSAGRSGRSCRRCRGAGAALPL